MYRGMRLAGRTEAEGTDLLAQRAPHRPIAALDDFLHLLATAIGDWHRRRDAIRQLRRVDDRTLRDIGIERDRIGEAVDGMLGGRSG